MVVILSKTYCQVVQNTLPLIFRNEVEVKGKGIPRLSVDGKASVCRDVFVLDGLPYSCGFFRVKCSIFIMA